MQEWAGTGRYRHEAGFGPWGLGGPASRLQIMKDLGRAGLADTANPRRIAVTDLGLRFLDMLHPDSEDRDLPFRLHAWTFLPEDVAGPKVDRYLRTFFGKQIRHLARQPDHAVPGNGPGATAAGREEGRERIGFIQGPDRRMGRGPGNTLRRPPKDLRSSRVSRRDEP